MSEGEAKPVNYSEEEKALLASYEGVRMPNLTPNVALFPLNSTFALRTKSSFALQRLTLVVLPTHPHTAPSRSPSPNSKMTWFSAPPRAWYVHDYDGLEIRSTLEISRRVYPHRGGV